MLKRFLLLIIHAYQRLISPFIGQHCRFHPSCSNYTCEAIETYGAAKGFWLGLKRIGRCHPLSEGGFDPVPNPHTHTK